MRGKNDNSGSEFMYIKKKGQTTFEYRWRGDLFWTENQGGLPGREDMWGSPADIWDLDMRLLGRKSDVLGHFTF